ncbi:hypothetical protein NBRC10513v2_003180 [Rhodotorula toruloides]|uniref:Uncharacterized protein n=1 Tax=Rhodotorula toruloides TaxID=5286 RepID=A0A2T0ABD8_RHOTO|nr:hypothetical protein AAT19DRAFT_14345 [Rhodotorula toruloides]
MSSNASETTAEAPQLRPDLPSPRLPPEILDRILDHIDGKTWSFYANQTRIDYGRSISLVCRAWRERGTAWVWSRVDLDLTRRDRKLQHMLAYPRTAKGLEMLYINAPLLWSQCSKNFESEETFDSYVKQVYRDMRQLISLCQNLRELQMMIVPGELFDALFPPESTDIYPTIRVITLRAFSRTDSDTFMRMLHAVPNVTHLSVPSGNLVLLNVDALTEQSALVRTLPTIHAHDLYLDWRPDPFTSVRHIVFANILLAIDPATLGQISLAPVEQRTMPLLINLLPRCSKLDYLSLIYQDQGALHESFEALVGIISYLPNLRAVKLRSYDPTPAAVQTEVSSDILAAFFSVLPRSVRSLKLHVLLPPVAADSNDLPNEMLEYIESRADTLLRCVECRFRRPEQVANVNISRRVWTPENSLYGGEEEDMDDESENDEAEDGEEETEEVEREGEEAWEGDDQNEAGGGNELGTSESPSEIIGKLSIDDDDDEAAQTGHAESGVEKDSTTADAGESASLPSPVAAATGQPPQSALDGGSAEPEVLGPASDSEARSFMWTYGAALIKAELESLYLSHDGVVRDCPARRQSYGHGWSLDYECWIGPADA